MGMLPTTMEGTESGGGPSESGTPQVRLFGGTGLQASISWLVTNSSLIIPVIRLDVLGVRGKFSAVWKSWLFCTFSKTFLEVRGLRPAMPISGIMPSPAFGCSLSPESVSPFVASLLLSDIFRSNSR